MNPAQPKPRSRFLFSALALLLVLIVLELTSFATYRMALGSWFSYGPNAEQRAALKSASEAPAAASETDEEPADQRPQEVRVPGSMAEERLHPFVGFVHAYPGVQGAFLQTTPWGFYRRRLDPPPAENAYRIGVVGGSAAFLFSFKGSERLAERIQDATFVGGRPVEVVSLALGGYKQPQQLMTVSWLLSMGEKFDLIVNLDGFNEVAFGVDNFHHKVFPTFPRNWALRIGGRDTLEDLEPLGRAAFWTDLRGSAAEIFDRAPLAYSVTGNLIWRLLDRAAAARIQQAEVDVARSTQADGLGYAESGPPYAGGLDEIYSTLAAHWRKSSILIDRLCRGSGTRYVHLLQPNQYVEGSKPMGDAEKAIAIDPNHLRREAVIQGYPALLAEANALLAAGVDFHDLTQLYADERAIVYNDSCCHVNQLGNDLIAEYLADALLAEGTPDNP